MNWLKRMWCWVARDDYRCPETPPKRSIVQPPAEVDIIWAKLQRGVWPTKPELNSMFAWAAAEIEALRVENGRLRGRLGRPTTAGSEDVDVNPPPVSKYQATIEITGNTHEELFERVRSLAKNWWHFHTDYGKRHHVNSTDGTTSVRLEHTNPEQTPEKYSAELEAWWERGKQLRKQPS